MRRIISISALIMLMVFTAAVLRSTIGQTTDNETTNPPVAGEQWEYLVVAGGTTNLSASANSSMRKEPTTPFLEAYPLETNMDKLGANGWELVSVGGSPNNPVYYFKRRK